MRDLFRSGETIAAVEKFNIFGHRITDDNVSHYVTTEEGDKQLHIFPELGVHRKIKLHNNGDLTERIFKTNGKTETIRCLHGRYDGQDIRLVTYYSEKPPSVTDLTPKAFILMRISALMGRDGYTRNTEIERELKIDDIDDDIENLPFHAQDDNTPETEQLVGAAFVSPLPSVESGNFRLLNPLVSDFCHPLVFQVSYTPSYPKLSEKIRNVRKHAFPPF